ncbi:hypothetical protein LTR94_033599, partial [Friedmanniomyces endolithicus]
MALRGAGAVAQDRRAAVRTGARTGRLRRRRFVPAVARAQLKRHASSSSGNTNNNAKRGFPMDAQEVLDFWFLPSSDPGHGQQRAAWFRKDDAFDAVIRERFGAAINHAIAGGLREWDEE